MLLIGRAPGESPLFTFTHEGHNLRGVIHVGANEGQEVYWYAAHKLLPLLCFEPHPAAYARMVESCSGLSDDVDFVNCALGSEDGTLKMLVPADGDDEKTSRYPPIPTPGHDWTAVPTGGTITVPVRRFDTWAAETNLFLPSFNALAIDVQGMELEVLRGFGDTLSGFEFLSVECSLKPVYDGEPTAAEVIEYLGEHGFVQQTPVDEHLDVLFRRL